MATGFTFGAKTTAAPSFGTGSITFGTPAAATFGTAAAATFGTPAAATFGTPAATSTATTQPQTQFSFGSLPTTNQNLFGVQSTPTSLGFKPTTTSSAGFSFGTSAPSTGFSFGAPTSSLGLGATTSTGSTFGTSLTTPAGGLNFGISTAATNTPNLTFDTTTTSAPQQNVGLGGIATTQLKSGSHANTQKELAPKEQVLPNEFAVCVEQFKNLVQEEKNRSSEVARCSVKEYHKVEAELDSLNQQLNQIQNQVLGNRYEAEQIKYDAAKGLQNIEMAQRTQDTPPSLQYDNNAPLQFFLDLADNFEREMQNLKIKIENTEKFVKKCNEPSVLTSQDLALGLRRLHETFVALAGRMQTVHNQVEAQKEAFLSLRKYVAKDNVNPFEKMTKSTEAIKIIMKNALKTNPPNLASGPTPFNSISLGTSNITLPTQQPPPPYSTATPLFGTATSNTSMFQPTGFGALNTSSNFQLQKPPTGNKRGKQ